MNNDKSLSGIVIAFGGGHLESDMLSKFWTSWSVYCPKVIKKQLVTALWSAQGGANSLQLQSARKPKLLTIKLTKQIAWKLAPDS